MKKSHFSVSALSLFSCSVIILLISTFNIFGNEKLQVSIEIAVLLLAWLLVYLITAFINYKNIYLFSFAYILPLGLFHFGMIVPHILGIVEFRILQGLSGHWFALAAWYSLLAISSLGIGLSLCFKRPINANTTNLTDANNLDTNLSKLRSMGRGLLWASILLLMIALIQHDNILAKSRFELFYQGDTRAIGVFSMLCPTAALILIVTAKQGRNFFRSFAATFIIFLIFTLSGYRSVALFPLVTGTIIWKKLGREIPTFILASAILIILVMIPIIGQLRMQSYSSIDVDKIATEADKSDISDSFTEMGRSITALAVTLENIPKIEDFRYGYTYLLYLPHLLPNIGFSQQSDHSRTALYKRMLRGENILGELIPGDWATLKLIPNDFKTGGGTGFTAVGEPYMNFGYLGVVFYFILLGWFLGKLDSINIGFHFNYLTFVSLYYWNLIVTVRNDLSVFLKPVLFTFLTVMIWKALRRFVPFLDKF